MEHLCQSVIYVNESATDFIIGVTRIFSGGALSPPQKKSRRSKKLTIKKVDFLVVALKTQAKTPKLSAQQKCPKIDSCSARGCAYKFSLQLRIKFFSPLWGCRCYAYDKF